MLRGLLELLFGCRHPRETWPQRRSNRTGRPAGVPESGVPYVVCLDCGRERDHTLLDADQRRSAQISVPLKEER